VATPSSAGDPASFVKHFGSDEFEGRAKFAIGDFDVLSRPEFSTGYVPTTLLVQNGKLVDKFSGNQWRKIIAFVG
jgi:thioredoxin-like negative regulator of GroEL